MVWAMDRTIYLVLYRMYKIPSIECIKWTNSLSNYPICISVRLPFDWKTPLGYFCCYIFETLSCFAVLYSILPTFCYAIGSYCVNSAQLQVIINEFYILGREISNGYDSELMKQFCDLIDDISDAEQLIESDF